MKTQTHTPGPWEVDEIDGGFLIGADIINGSHIAEAMSLPDANLIASAPELLEALTGLHDFMLSRESYKRTILYAKTITAIRKAEGRI